MSLAGIDQRKPSSAAFLDVRLPIIVAAGNSALQKVHFKSPFLAKLPMLFFIGMSACFGRSWGSQQSRALVSVQCSSRDSSWHLLRGGRRSPPRHIVAANQGGSTKIKDPHECSNVFATSRHRRK